MADHELTVEESLRALDELFRCDDVSVPNRRCRRYVLEFHDGKPVFRSTDNGRDLPRSEDELAIDRIFEEEFGDDIVPQKLAKLFPGSNFETRRY